MSFKSSEKSTWDDPASLKDKMSLIPETLKNDIPFSNSASDDRRKIFVMRHGERTDLVFGKFYPYSFDANGKYTRKDLNMPKSFPPRKNIQDWHYDTPLTNVGIFQATLVGESLKDSGERIDVAFCSPMFRCIQSCQATLKGLGVEDKVKICIEPALMEYMAFYADNIPGVMSPNELKEIGFNVDLDYVPMMTVDDVKAKADESFVEFYHRNARVTQRIIDECHGNVLISAHGSNLDTNTRFAVGGEIRTTREMSETLSKVGFCALVVIAEDKKSQKWSFTTPPLNQISHAPNPRFDYRIFTDTKTT
ncbi:ecdysteroid-phosphate phosphatase-like [Culicoides brevitarsis]|uniref:ecdysteroid-phosphate phosphatase-like n=1 Tax=Culicoides brevitarsis TaxID=469753 RepID=UPI00307B53C8